MLSFKGTLKLKLANGKNLLSEEETKLKITIV